MHPLHPGGCIVSIIMCRYINRQVFPDDLCFSEKMIFIRTKYKNSALWCASQNTLKNAQNGEILTKILIRPSKLRIKHTFFLIKNARIYAQYEFIYSSLYLVKRKIKLPLSAKTALLSRRFSFLFSPLRF